jgi:hypothetical protein
MRYQDLGADYYERRAQIGRQIARHVGKLGALGFEVTLCRISQPSRVEPGTLTPPDPYRPYRTRRPWPAGNGQGPLPPALIGLYSGQKAGAVPAERPRFRR